jgi:hypothetical protein
MIILGVVFETIYYCEIIFNTNMLKLLSKNVAILNQIRSVNLYYCFISLMNLLVDESSHEILYALHRRLANQL